MKNSFWITNISNRNVSIADLNLTINAYCSVNLLDNKHYDYTLDQLNKSATSGSIAKKKHCLSIRKNEPELIKINVPLLQETYISAQPRSILEIKDNKYDELKISDEDFLGNLEDPPKKLTNKS